MLKAVVIILVGAGLGALMGYFGKCSSGSCPLTANPYRGAAWGAFLALIIAYPMIVRAFSKPLPSSPNVIHVDTEDDFSAAIAKGVCLVDFYADWCGPCRALSPTINQIADDYKDRAKVLKINVDKFPSLARKYNAGSIPTVIVLKDSAEIARAVGARPASSYTEILDQALAK